MKAYIGTKVIKAEMMGLGNFNKHFRGEKNQVKPVDGETEGYHVEYEDGYHAWSPKGVFERCYREITLSELKIVCKGVDGA